MILLVTVATMAAATWSGTRSAPSSVPPAARAEKVLLVGVPGLALLVADFEPILVVVGLVSILAGAAGGWTAGVGHARAGGEEMLPPEAATRMIGV